MIDLICIFPINVHFFQNEIKNTFQKSVIKTFMSKNRMRCNTREGVDEYSTGVRPKEKICVFPVSRPTLIFSSDPKVFIRIP